MKKWLTLAAGLILILAAVSGYVYYKKGSRQAAAPQVRTTEVRKGSISVSVSGSGSVTAVDRQTINAGTTGTVDKVLVKEGDLVKKGQVLFTFKGKDLSDQINQEEMNLKKKQTDLANAQKTFKETAQDGDVDSLKANIASLQLDVEASRSKIAEYEKEAAPPDPITAPIDGEITVLKVQEGGEINGNAEAAEIVNYQKLQVVIKVDELDLPKLKEGMKADITVDAFPDKKFAGEVTDIGREGTTTNGVSVFDVTIGLNESDGVRVGMSAEAMIHVQDKSDTLVLPIEAVQQIQGKYVVFVPSGETSAEGASASGPPAGAGSYGGRNGQSGGNTGSSEGRASGGGTAPGGNGTRNGSGSSGGQWNGLSAERSGPTQGARDRIMKQVEVGLHNETQIEITGGLKEGDKVILPTLASSSRTQQQSMGGFGGFGGFGGGFGGVPRVPSNFSRGGGGR